MMIKTLVLPLVAMNMSKFLG